MNVILIVSDTFRYDNLFDRAEMPVRTPELDRFAGRAVELSRMYTASFPTIPHRTDLTTGRYGWPWYGWQDRRGSSPDLLTSTDSFLSGFWPRLHVKTEAHRRLREAQIALVEPLANRHQGLGVAGSAQLFV